MPGLDQLNPLMHHSPIVCAMLKREGEINNSISCYQKGIVFEDWGVDDVEKCPSVR